MAYYYKPIPPALPYHQSSARIKILVCGARSGKTRAVIGGEAISDAILQPGYYKRDIDSGEPYGIMITAPTFKMIKMIDWPLLKNAIDPGNFIRESLSDRIIWVQGIHGITQIVCASYEQGSAKIEGIPLYRAYCDECFQMPETFYHEIQTRLADRRGKMTLIGTPKPVQWLMDLIQDANENKNIFFHRWKTIDNPYFPADQIEYLQKVLPRKVFARNFEAALDSFIGQIYEDFSYQHHAKSFDIKQENYEVIWGSMDWGYSHNAAMYIFGLRDDDQVDVLHEVSENGLTVISPDGEQRTWASILSHYEKLYREKFDCYHAGPDRPENIAALRALGIPIKAADDAVIEGLQFCSSIMHVDATGHTRLRIHKENCPKLIQKLPMLRWAENADGSLSEKQLKKDDDEADSFRYGLFSKRKWFRVWDTMATYLEDIPESGDNNRHF